PGFQLHVHRNRISDLKTVNFPALLQQFLADEAKPRNKAEILALLRSSGEEFASFVEALSEEFLAERVTTPFGPDPTVANVRSRFEMLLAPKEHEMHHRGQLMVAQRMIGLVPHLTRQMQQRLAQAQASAGQQQRGARRSAAFRRAAPRFCARWSATTPARGSSPAREENNNTLRRPR